MIDRILVPLDGSTLAERALPLASLLAQRAGTELVLMRSTEWDRAVAAIYVSGDTVADLTEQYVQAARDYLAACRREGSPTHPTSATLDARPRPWVRIVDRSAAEHRR